MDIGTGIAIAGVWLFPGASALSKTVSNAGLLLSIFTSTVITIILICIT